MSVLLKRILGIFLSLLCIITGTGVCCLICNHPSEEAEDTIVSFYREAYGSLDTVMIGSRSIIIRRSFGAKSRSLPTAWPLTHAAPMCMYPY